MDKNSNEHKDKKSEKISVKGMLFLQFTVFIFALSAVFSKQASNFLAEGGYKSIGFIVCFLIYGVLTAFYAFAWQLNLEKYKLSFLYMNRSFYMVWTQIFAVLIFNNSIHINNVIGLGLIIAGVWVNSKDV